MTLFDPIMGIEMSMRDIDVSHFHAYFFINYMTVRPVLISALREV